MFYYFFLKNNFSFHFPAKFNSFIKNTRKPSLWILHAYSLSNIVRDESSHMMLTAGEVASRMGERGHGSNPRTFSIGVFDLKSHHFYLPCEHVSNLERLDEMSPCQYFKLQVLIQF